MMPKMISERLNFICRNQQKLRADDYIHLRDALNQDASVNAANIGQNVILSFSFTGSPSYLDEKTKDAMTYVRNYGRPDVFVTFTCNPEWKDIKQELFPDQRSFDRHDNIAQVFHLKLKIKTHKNNHKKRIFGPVKCYMHGWNIDASSIHCTDSSHRFSSLPRCYSSYSLLTCYCQKISWFLNC
ncbi:unnamed protein product [Euphydryas editha]|uniref:Helitron helicase-like domain-containing protein n=1 Tax=Euphydryas editha TaxID=104508 RepID=A0AAU9URH2_EUPED|nr:unnamed protein product [Euphydryas editha]